MEQPLADYIVSEKFIHDDLLSRAQSAVEHLYVLWKKDRKIEPSLLTWPSDPVASERGEIIDGVCCLRLPDEESERRPAIRLMVERTKAYGLFVVEQLEDHVRALLETPHGTRCWKLPIIKSGADLILGKYEITNDLENEGLLWSYHRAVA